MSKHICIFQISLRNCLIVAFILHLLNMLSLPHDRFEINDRKWGLYHQETYFVSNACDAKSVARVVLETNRIFPDKILSNGIQHEVCHSQEEIELIAPKQSKLCVLGV